MKWLNELDSYKDSFIEDLRGFIRIPSLRNDTEACAGAPFGKDVRKALDYILNLAKKEGFEVKDYDGYAGVISYGEGEESIGMLGHIDIVPIGEDWTKDPLGGEIVDGVMFGRGVLDDKGPTMAGLYALKMLRDNNVKLNKKIMLIIGCDEESGMQCMEYYVKHGEIPARGFVPDADFPVIYGEKGRAEIHIKGNMDTVITSMHCGERANVVIGKADATAAYVNDEILRSFDFYLASNQLEGKAVVNGDQVTYHIDGIFSHAAMPYNGVNAALHLLNFIGAAYNDTFAKDTYVMLKDWQGRGVNIQKEGAYMGFLTMNTGIIHVENNEISIVVDIRYPNETNGTEIMKGFMDKKCELEYPLDIILDDDTNPLFVDPNSELVTTLMDIYREYTGDTFTPAVTIGGGTYAKKLPNFVAFGPEFPTPRHSSDQFIGGPHQRDEGIFVDDLLTAVAIYTQSLEELAK